MTSFVILNYNSTDLCMKCVRSIVRYMPSGTYEIVIVDNGSRADEVERLKRETALLTGSASGSPASSSSSSCRVVTLEQNTGFGTGNQVGASVAQGRFLCFLNSDVVLTADCVTPLCRYLDEHPDVGCITPVQQKVDGRRSRSFRHDMGIAHELLGDGLRERLWPRRFPPRDSVLRESCEPVSVMQVNGSFMLFPASKFWAIGGFDTTIFLYYEEYDLARRLQMHGWRRVVHPQYTFLHVHDASTSSMRRLALKENFVSKLYVYRKYHGWLFTVLFMVVVYLQLAMKPHKWYILRALLHGDILSQSMRHHMRQQAESLQ